MIYLGFLIANAAGKFNGTLTVNALSLGDTITGTATDEGGNTSEFATNTSILAPFLSDVVVKPSPDPSVYGQTVTLTATVAAVLPAVATPTGTVTFLDGATTIGTASVSGGTATLTISTLAAANHSITATYSGDSQFQISIASTVTLDVTPASLTVTTIHASKVYGQSNPSFAASYAGFVNGDNASGLTGNLTFSSAATAASPVGVYGVTPSGLTSSNYSITFADGTLDVTPASLTVTAIHASKVYGQNNPSFAASYAGFVNGDNAGGLTGSLIFTRAATVSSPVGTYGITPSGLTSSDYSITFADGTLDVTPASLTVTAIHASKVYGQNNPSFAASYTGFVNGDNAGGLTGSLNFTQRRHCRQSRWRLWRHPEWPDFQQLFDHLR